MTQCVDWHSEHRKNVRQKLLVAPCISVPITLLSKEVIFPSLSCFPDNKRKAVVLAVLVGRKDLQLHKLEKYSSNQRNYGSSWASQSPFITQGLGVGVVGRSFSLPSIQFEMLILYCWGKSTSDSSPSSGLRTCAAEQLQVFEMSSWVLSISCFRVNNIWYVSQLWISRQEWFHAGIRKICGWHPVMGRSDQRTTSTKGPALTFAFVYRRCSQNITDCLNSRYLCPPVLETGGPRSKYLWIQCLEKTHFLVPETIIFVSPYCNSRERSGFSL